MPAVISSNTYRTLGTLHVMLTFARLGRHCSFSTTRAAEGGGYDPLAISPLMELDSRKKRIRRYETQRLVLDFKVSGQPVHSEVRSSAPRYEFGLWWSSSHSGSSNDILFIWVESTKGVDLGSRTGHSPPVQEVGRRRSCRISFDSAVLPESSGGFCDSLAEYD